MSRSAYRSWAESFSEGDKELWMLAEQDDVRFLMSKSRTSAPVFHVWRGDRWFYCGQNILEACSTYERISR